MTVVLRGSGPAPGGSGPGLEELNLDLGSGTNRLTVESTHAGPSTTLITSQGGDDLYNVQSIGGPTTVDAGAGSDIIRIGSTTGSIGQLEGVPDPFSTSRLNDGSTPFIRSRLTVIGGEGSNDQVKVYDGADTSDEQGTLVRNELLGFGMPFGIGYAGFEVLKLWLGAGNTGLYIDSTHTGVTVIDTGDEAAVPDVVNDEVCINSTSGPTTITLGEGNDVVKVNYDSEGNQTFLSGIDGVLTLHGQQGSDLYDIGLAGGISSPPLEMM